LRFRASTRSPAATEIVTARAIAFQVAILGIVCG
jgi:hypothetical protein